MMKAEVGAKLADWLDFYDTKSRARDGDCAPRRATIFLAQQVLFSTSRLIAGQHAAHLMRILAITAKMPISNI